MSATTPPTCSNCYQPVRQCENATFGLDEPGCLHGNLVHEIGGHYCWSKPAPGAPFTSVPWASRGGIGRHRRDRLSGQRVVWSYWHKGWARLGIWPGGREMFI